MGFAQVKGDGLDLPPDADGDAWVEKCDPAQDTVAQKNPSGAGTHKNEAKYKDVGVKCQGFAQRHSDSYVQYDGDK